MLAWYFLNYFDDVNADCKSSQATVCKQLLRKRFYFPSGLLSNNADIWGSFGWGWGVSEFTSCHLEHSAAALWNLCLAGTGQGSYLTLLTECAPRTWRQNQSSSVQKLAKSLRATAPSLWTPIFLLDPVILSPLSALWFFYWAPVCLLYQFISLRFYYYNYSIQNF